MTHWRRRISDDDELTGNFACWVLVCGMAMLVTGIPFLVAHAVLRAREMMIF